MNSNIRRNVYKFFLNPSWYESDIETFTNSDYV